MTRKSDWVETDRGGKNFAELEDRIFCGGDEGAFAGGEEGATLGAAGAVGDMIGGEDVEALVELGKIEGSSKAAATNGSVPAVRMSPSPAITSVVTPTIKPSVTPAITAANRVHRNLIEDL